MVHAQVGDNVFARSALARQLLHPTPGLPFSILLYTQGENVPPSSGVPALRPCEQPHPWAGRRNISNCPSSTWSSRPVVRPERRSRTSVVGPNVYRRTT